MPATTTFLLIEDDDNDATFVEREFRLAPASVQLIRVSDGIEAVRYLKGEGDYADRQKHPVPDVILLDLRMSKFTGFDFLEWLRWASPRNLRLIPVVVMSVSNQEADINRAYSLGVTSYLVKPVDWHVFRERIRALDIYWRTAPKRP